MLITQETYINATERCVIGETGWYEAFTDDLGKLFRALQKAYGGCVSKVYVDTPDGTPDEIGWVFQRQDKYEDADKWYTLEVWVTYKQVLALPKGQ